MEWVALTVVCLVVIAVVMFNYLWESCEDED